MEMTIYNNDCLEQLKAMPDECIDSVVTDPPYGLAFMGKKWDYDVPSVEIWKEVYRVLKPGGHLLSFGGTRTYHRMVVNIEEAGFEIRDQIMWIYGSGFPKSMDVSKAIDKQAGEKPTSGYISNKENEVFGKGKGNKIAGISREPGLNLSSLPVTDSAKQWQGWGTALKPANEPICMARKPLSEKTVASNVLKHGTGAINIDETRVGTETIKISKGKGFGDAGIYGTGINTVTANTEHQGRWPANVIFDEEAGKVLDEQSGQLKSGAIKPHHKNQGAENIGTFKIRDRSGEYDIKSSTGGASRFFYCAKASKSERNAGLEDMEDKKFARNCAAQAEIKGTSQRENINNSGYDKIQMVKNFHPTVKPIKLMEYLCKLVTPPNGTVLDPFMGSGTTGIAAKNLGFGFVGIERDAEYFEIAKRRTA